jgi:MFS family permease
MSSSAPSTPPFAAIFAGSLVFNILATLRSSEWYKNNHGNNNTKKASDAAAAPSLSTLEETNNNKDYAILLRNYLVVYLLATCSDWLQGPYVYALYSDYGYSQHDIAVLFVAGFGSSMVFGSFIGGMADWGGRKRFVMLFSVIYAMSCMTKREYAVCCINSLVSPSPTQPTPLSFSLILSDFRNFYILMIGRLLGGIATSLLFSVFEAWLIRSHSNLKLKHLLGKSFAWASYGNSVVAILAGLLANKAASNSKLTSLTSGGGFYVGGYLNPFDIALVCLISCGTACFFLWDENYGQVDQLDSTDSTKSNQKWYDGLRSAFVTTTRNMDILLCGLISSLFEGSMYIFVFMWTPALSAANGDGEKLVLPFGLIFATFMVCCMCGASMFGILTEHFKGEQLAVAVFAVASLSMGSVAVSSSKTMKFLAMNVFEIMVGMYWPLMGTMKGMIVPESKRAAIYNLFRIPLNFIVLFSLLTDLTPRQSFALNCIMLGTASVMQYALMKRREACTGANNSSNTMMDVSEQTSHLLAPQRSLDSVEEEVKDADV